MTDAHDAWGPAPRGLAVAYGVIAGILMVLFALATYVLASAAIAKGDRTGLAISLIPGLLTVAFAAILSMVVVQRRKEKVIAERCALNPNQPWLWTDKWMDGRIRSGSSWGLAVLVVVFAAVWNAAFWAGGLAAYRRGDLGRSTGWVFLLIANLVGVGLIAGAAYLVVLARKYPRTVFELTSMPGVLGGRLEGSIQIPSRVAAGAEARVKLDCSRSVSSRSSYGPSTVTLWQDEQTLTTPDSYSLPVAFTIPFDLPPSELPELSGTSSSSKISWSLSVTVRTPGVDYQASYTLPVFATDASDPSIVRGAVDASRPADRPSHAKAILVESTADRTVFALPPAKGLGCGISAFVILPLLAWAITRSAVSENAVATSLMVSGIALVVGAAILALFGVGVALMATSIEIDGEAIRVPHGRWPVGWVRTIPLADVAEVRFSSTQTQRVEVLTRQGASYWISGEMSGPEEAKWLAAEVTHAVERYRAPAATSA